MIDVKNLTKSFKDLVAVNDVTFSVQKGEIFAFLGPNGAGKSTTIKMLTTLLQPTAGTMRLDGHDPVREQPATRKTFGIVFQDPSLDDELTALENLVLHAVMYSVPDKVRNERIQRMLEFVELWDRRNHLVKTFSGGMKRRLEIARGLLHHPKILFLDEPTIGLDPQTRNHIWSYIEELNRSEGITVFFTTHYMEEAERVAQRVAVIDGGKIVAQGTPDELKAQTKQATLEDAFLQLTGKTIRSEERSSTDRMRQHRQMWRR